MIGVGVAGAIAFSIVTVLHVVIGELSPKSVAISRTGPTVLVVAPLMRAFYFLTKPLVDLFNGMGNLLLKPFGIPPAREAGHAPHSEAELHALVRQSGEQGVLERAEQRVTQAALTFDERRVREVMRPRPEVVLLPRRTRFASPPTARWRPATRGCRSASPTAGSTPRSASSTSRTSYAPRSTARSDRSGSSHARSCACRSLCCCPSCWRHCRRRASTSRWWPTSTDGDRPRDDGEPARAARGRYRRRVRPLRRRAAAPRRRRDAGQRVGPAARRARGARHRAGGRVARGDDRRSRPRAPRPHAAARRRRGARRSPRRVLEIGGGRVRSVRLTTATGAASV